MPNEALDRIEAEIRNRLYQAAADHNSNDGPAPFLSGKGATYTEVLDLITADTTG